MLIGNRWPIGSDQIPAGASTDWQFRWSIMANGRRNRQSAPCHPRYNIVHPSEQNLVFCSDNEWWGSGREVISGKKIGRKEFEKADEKKRKLIRIPQNWSESGQWYRQGGPRQCPIRKEQHRGRVGQSVDRWENCEELTKIYQGLTCQCLVYH